MIEIAGVVLLGAAMAWAIIFTLTPNIFGEHIGIILRAMDKARSRP